MARCRGCRLSGCRSGSGLLPLCCLVWFVGEELSPTQGLLADYPDRRGHRGVGINPAHRTNINRCSRTSTVSLWTIGLNHATGSFWLASRGDLIQLDETAGDETLTRVTLAGGPANEQGRCIPMPPLRFTVMKLHVFFIAKAISWVAA